MLPFDDAGRVLSGHNGGDTRGFIMFKADTFVMGFSKNGNLSNPYSFGYLMPMEHPAIQRHAHDAGAHGRVSSRRCQVLCCAWTPLHGTLVNSRLIERGSTFKTEDLDIALKSRTNWFRPVAIADGPDGAAMCAIGTISKWRTSTPMSARWTKSMVHFSSFRNARRARVGTETRVGNGSSVTRLVSESV